ncbi:MAG: DUF2207 domain-containing protein [Firmicutes bacterium]|nr:DUF2207 domain-containing protein [Bacillota bacterium]
MKKIYIIITLVLLMMFIPVKISAYEEGISKYYIDMTILDNGDLHVKELIILNGDFNGFQRIINYSNNRLQKFDGSLNSFRGSDIYNGTGIELISIKNIKADSNSDFNVLYNSGDIFEEVSSASKGDYGVFVRDINANGEEYLIYNPDKGSEKGFYLEYTLENVGVVHNDVSEVAVNLFDELTEYVDILEMKIHVPNNENLLRGWAHGPLTGEITLVNNNLIEVRATKIEPNNPIDVRFAFDKAVLNNSTKFSNVEALDKIVEVETELANIANSEREQYKKYLEAEAKSLVAYAKENPTRENYEAALTSVNYLSNGIVKTDLEDQLKDILLIVETKEKYVKILFVSILAVWSLGLILIIRHVYKRYDKEYEAQFKGDYYREIPANYGPEVLGYLLNKKVGSNELSASLMNLVYKKVVIAEKVPNVKKEDYIFKRQESSIKITAPEQKALQLLFNDRTEVKLSVFKKEAKTLYTSFLDTYNDWVLQATALSEAEEFYEENNKKYVWILYSVLGFILTFMLYRNYINMFIYIIMFCLSLGSLIYFASITKRSKKGNEDYAKWKGLQRFLNDFSTMDTKSLPEIVLWEKYLVYSITLGCAKKLAKDMQIKVQEMNVYDSTMLDMYDIGYMLNLNRVINSTIISSVQAAQAELTREKMSEISSSSSSSGGGFGGGFSSGGGSFGGGGGGGRF